MEPRKTTASATSPKCIVPAMADRSQLRGPLSRCGRWNEVDYSRPRRPWLEASAAASPYMFGEQTIALKDEDEIDEVLGAESLAR